MFGARVDGHVTMGERVDDDGAVTRDADGNNPPPVLHLERDAWSMITWSND